MDKKGGSALWSVIYMTYREGPLGFECQNPSGNCHSINIVFLVLGCPRSSLRFFCNSLLKNTNGLFWPTQWIIKKAEHQRTDAVELWSWRRLLRVPWAARRSNQSILKEINPEYSLEGLMLKLKLQYFVHLMQRASSLEKTLMLGKKAKGEGSGRE